MSKIKSSRLKRLLSEWEARQRNRDFPARGDFTPFDLKYILGNLSLIDVAYDPLRFHFRIHGSNLAERLGKEMTNKSADELPNPDFATRVQRQFTEVIQRRAPMIFSNESEYPGDHLPHEVEALLLPLSDDGKTIDMIMSAVVWDKK
jgi:hypothetical protein